MTATFFVCKQCKGL